MTQDTRKKSCPAWTRRKVRPAFVILAVVLTVILTSSDYSTSLLQKITAWIELLGPWSAVVFVIVYVIGTLLLIPGSLLGLAAGAIYGIVPGILLVSFASTLGATCAFCIGRSAGRDRLSKKFARNRTFTALDRAILAEGWKIVFLSRLSPVIPFALSNYAFGLTCIPLRQYILASWIGMMPGTAMYVYLGSLSVLRVGEQGRTPGEWVALGLGLLATVAVVVISGRIAKRALHDRYLNQSSTPPDAHRHPEPSGI